MQQSPFWRARQAYVARPGTVGAGRGEHVVSALLSVVMPTHDRAGEVGAGGRLGVVPGHRRSRAGRRQRQLLRRHRGGPRRVWPRTTASSWCAPTRPVGPCVARNRGLAVARGRARGVLRRRRRLVPRRRGRARSTSWTDTPTWWRRRRGTSSSTPAAEEPRCSGARSSTGREQLLWQNFVGLPFAVFRRARACSFDVSFDPDLPTGEDWDLWLRCAAGRARCAPCRTSGTSTPSTAGTGSRGPPTAQVVGRRNFLAKHGAEMSDACRALPRDRARRLRARARPPWRAASSRRRDGPVPRQRHRRRRSWRRASPRPVPGQRRGDPGPRRRASWRSMSGSGGRRRLRPGTGRRRLRGSWERGDDAWQRGRSGRRARRRIVLGAGRADAPGRGGGGGAARPAHRRGFPVEPRGALSAPASTAASRGRRAPSCWWPRPTAPPSGSSRGRWRWAGCTGTSCVRDGVAGVAGRPAPARDGGAAGLETLRHGRRGPPGPGGGELLAVAVDPRWRARHVGGTSGRRASWRELDRARRDARRTSWWARTMRAAIAMYRRAGFTPAQHLRDAPGHRVGPHALHRGAGPCGPTDPPALRPATSGRERRRPWPRAWCSHRWRWRWPDATGIVDRPGPLKPQAAPVPYLGGVAVFVAALVGRRARATRSVIGPLAGAVVLGVARRPLRRARPGAAGRRRWRWARAWPRSSRRAVRGRRGRCPRGRRDRRAHERGELPRRPGRPGRRRRRRGRVSPSPSLLHGGGRDVAVAVAGGAGRIPRRTTGPRPGSTSATRVPISSAPAWRPAGFGLVARRRARRSAWPAS